MSRRSVAAGLVAATLLAAFYAGVINWASGLDHLAGQAGADWPYLTVIVVGFAVQAALLVELRRRRRTRRIEHAAAGMGAGASVAGMIACCAHHLVDLVPLVGLSGAAAFLTDWRIEFMLAGIAVNAIGVAVAARRLHDDRRHPTLVGGAWHAA